MAQYFQPDLIHMVTGCLKISLNTQEWTPYNLNNVTEAYATKINILHGLVEIVHIDITALIAYGVADRNGYMQPGGFSSIGGKFDCIV